MMRKQTTKFDGSAVRFLTALLVALALFVVPVFAGCGDKSDGKDPAPTTYTVTVNAASNGTVTANKTKAAKGETVTLTVTPAGGYELDTLVYNDGSDHNITGNSFTMPAHNVTVTATFKASESPADTYGITVNAATNGTVTADKATAEAGETVTLTVNPDSGYELDTLVYNDGSDHTLTSAPYTFTMPAHNVTVTATFKASEQPPATTYGITVNTATNGTVTADKTTAEAGETVTLTVTPANGYELDTLVYNDGSDHALTSAPYTFTMPAHDVTVTATFKKTDYTITKASVENGTLTVKSTAKMGDTVTVTATPDSGYELDTLSYNDGTDHDIKATGSFTMPAHNVTVSATFVELPPSHFSINKAAVVNGTLTVNKSSAEAGDTVTVTATPAIGYELDTLTYNDGADHDIKATGSFTMPAHNVTVTATFKAINYTVTVNTATNGSVTADKTTAIIGDTVTLAVTPATGYEIDTLVYNDGTSHTVTGNSFTMPAHNVTVSATFKAINYTVTVNSATNGTVTADKAAAKIGDTVTLTVTPATGYEIDTLVYNDGTAHAVTGNSFIMPAHNVTVTATFKAINYTVTVNSATNGMVTADKAAAKIGDTVTLTVTPATGYEIDTLTYNDGSDHTVTGNSFTMPAHNVTVTATFKKTVYTVTVATATNGTVTVSKDTAVIGDEITVTAVAANGYLLASLTANDEDITATKKFTVAARDVTVTATFTCAVTSVDFGTVSNAENPYKGRTDNIVNIVDGDADTAAAFSRTGLVAGGYVEYDLGESKNITSLIVYPGRKDPTGALTDSFAGHVSILDNSGTETNVGSFARGESAFVATGFTVNGTLYGTLSVRKVRVYVDTLPGGWIAVSEILIDRAVEGCVGVKAVDLGSLKESTVLKNVIDGDETTSARFARQEAQVGGYIGFDLLADTKLDYLRVLNGYNASGSDKMVGVAEYYNGTEWVSLGALAVTSTCFEPDVTTRYVRLRVTELPAWLGVREVYINSLGDMKGVPDVSHYSTLSNQGSDKFALIDGDPATFAWFQNPGAATVDDATGLHTGKYIDIELFDVTEIYQLRVLSDEGNDYFAGYIQYSLNGETWTELYHITGKDDAALSLEDDQKITAKYLRFVADRAANWSKIYEIYVNELGDIDFIYKTDNFGPLFGGTSYSAMFDGDFSTYAHFVRPSVNGTLRIEFSGVRTISSLFIATGLPEGGDTVTGVVEYSDDGKNYTQIMTLSGEKNYIKLDASITPRYLRIRDTGSTAYVAIREIVFNPLNEIVRDVTLEGGFATLYQGVVENMFDGDENSLLWFGATPDADSYLQLNLCDERDITSVRVLSGDASGGDKFTGKLTYSLDGTNWTELGNVDAADKTLTLDGAVSAKYIRLIGGECGGWVKIREITIA